MSSAAAFLQAVAADDDTDSGSVVPDVVRSRMGPSFRSLLKIAENESVGRMDTRWKLTEVRSGVRVFRKAALADDGTSAHAFRAMTTVNASPSTLAALVMNVSYGKRWIPSMREVRLLKAIDENSDVVYLGRQQRRISDWWSARRSPAQLAASIIFVLFLVDSGLCFARGDWLQGALRLMMAFLFLLVLSERLYMWPRDYVLMRLRHRVAEHTYVVGLRSVADESCPPLSPWLVVRGNLTGGGFIIQGLSGGDKSRISFISQADFGGWARMFGPYTMHVDMLELLVSLKNFVEAEVIPVAVVTSTPGQLNAASQQNNNNNNNLLSPVAMPVKGGGGGIGLSSGGSGTYGSNGSNATHAVSHTPVDVIPAKVDSYDDDMSDITSDFLGGKSVQPESVVMTNNISSVSVGNSSTLDFNKTISSTGFPREKKSAVTSTDAHKKMYVSVDNVLENFSEDDSAKAPLDARAFAVRTSFDLPRPPRFGDVAVAVRELALKMVAEGTGDDWTFVQTNKGVNIWQKKMGEGKPNMVRGVLKGIPACAGAMMATFCNLETKNKWDSMFMKGHIVENLDEFTQIGYERFHPIFPTSSRDFVILYTTMKRPDGSYVRASVSVEHMECPEVSGVVRGQVMFASLVTTPDPNDASLCDCTYTMQVDLKGSIPAWITARVSSDQPAMLASVRDLVINDEKTDPYFDPLQAKFERIKVVHGPPQPSSPIPLDTGTSVHGNLESISTFPTAGRDQMDNNKGKDIERMLSPPLKTDGLGVGGGNDGNNNNNNNSNNNNNNNNTSMVSEGRSVFSNDELNGSIFAVSSVNESSARKRESVEGVLDSSFEDGGGAVVAPGGVAPSPASAFSSAAGTQSSPRQGYYATEVELVKMFAGPPKVRTPSQSDAGLLAQTFRRLLAAASDRSDVWVSKGTQDDVAILSREPEPGSSLRSFKGYGVINVSADDVKRLVCDLSTQQKWDPLFKCGWVVERYDDVTDLRYVVYQTQQCLVKTSRNFVYMLGVKQLPDKTWIVAAIGKDRPDLPIYKGSVRGTIEASGWVIQPFPNQTDKCLVTYVSTADLGGLPSAVVNLVQVKQPLLIATVRKALTGTKSVKEDSK